MPGARQHPPAVVLVGFMGAGKTTIGHELARRLGLPFVDSDALIVAIAGPVAGIFAERGEAGFRSLEADVVTAELGRVRSAPEVLSLGGGAVLSDAVRDALAPVPLVVWITASPDELWHRVSAPGDERPLARDEQEFRRLLAAREPLYREVAKIVVETDGRLPAEIAEELAGRARAAAAPLWQAGCGEGVA